MVGNCEYWDIEKLTQKIKGPCRDPNSPHSLNKSGSLKNAFSELVPNSKKKCIQIQGIPLSK